MHRILSYFKLRPDPRTTSLLTSKRAECGRCAKCVKLLQTRFPIRHSLHLQDEHGLSQDDSIQLIEDVYKYLYIPEYRETMGQ